MTDHANTSPESLAHLALGDLPDHQRTAVERAIECSAPARDTLIRIRSTLNLLSTTKLHEPPAHALQAALRLMQATPDAQSTPSWLARVADAIATLAFDSFTPAAALGLRSTLSVDTRHLTFDSDVGEIDVELRYLAHQRVLVTGQLSFPSVQDQLVRVGYVDSASSGETNTDAKGRFTFEVAPGTLHIKLQLASRIIGLPAIATG